MDINEDRKLDTNPADDKKDLSEEEGKNRQFVTFYIGEECFAFDMNVVQEIIWVPETVRVPLTPPSLIGLANLRGTILPVLDLRTILGLEKRQITENSRVVIIDIGQPISFLVDKIDRVIQVEEDDIEQEKNKQELQADFLIGVIRHPKNKSILIQVLDGKKIVKREFYSEHENIQSSGADLVSGELYSKKQNREDEDENIHQVVSFNLDIQEFALEVSEIKEIVRYPDEIYHVPDTDECFMGIINYRGETLAIVNLNKMLGLKSNHDPEQSRILVATCFYEENIYEVGLVVDRVCEIFKVSENEWDPLPDLLQNSSDQKDIRAVCRLENGKRLVSVLSLKDMMKHPAMEIAISMSQEYKESSMEDKQKQETMEEDEIQLVVFRLKDEEYGILIENIQEIILVPEEINIVPKTPEYIEGMINLRGRVLPVMDMRKRLGLPSTTKKESQRIIVLNTRGVSMGFIVDSVSEVLSVDKIVMENVPKMSKEQADVLDRVINLKEQGRMIFIINVEKLLKEEEFEEISSISEDN